MKKITSISLVLLIIISCRSILFSQERNVYKSVIKAYIETMNSKTKIDPNKYVLIVGAQEEKLKGGHSIAISFYNIKLLSGFNYTKVYKFEDYKVITDELMDRSIIFDKILEKTEYENFNLGIGNIEYDPVTWVIHFDSKNKVIRISPQQKSKEIKELLLKNGVKFSKEFDDN